jgi:hypothetical protein
VHQIKTVGIGGQAIEPPRIFGGEMQTDGDRQNAVAADDATLDARVPTPATADPALGSPATRNPRLPAKRRNLQGIASTAQGGTG